MCLSSGPKAKSSLRGSLELCSLLQSCCFGPDQVPRCQSYLRLLYLQVVYLGVVCVTLQDWLTGKSPWFSRSCHSWNSQPMRSSDRTTKSDSFHHRICASLPKEMVANCFWSAQELSFSKLDFGQTWVARYRLGERVGHWIRVLCSTKLVV